MDRKEFVKLGCCAFAFITAKGLSAADAPKEAAPACDARELTFIQNWVTDLMETIDTEMPPEAKIKLMRGTGRGCYRRHPFKAEIAKNGQGSVDKLVEAMKKNFECWRDGDKVHIRFGEKNTYGCYCPAARYRPGKPQTDIHCYCTAATLASIWEAAIGREPKIQILQSVRRGDPTCHFLVQIT